MAQRTIALMTLAALCVVGWSAVRKTHQRRLAAQPRAKPVALQTWEGEGGGLPKGVPEVAPSTTAESLR